MSADDTALDLDKLATFCDNAVRAVFVKKNGTRDEHAKVINAPLSVYDAERLIAELRKARADLGFHIGAHENAELALKIALDERDALRAEVERLRQPHGLDCMDGLGEPLLRPLGDEMSELLSLRAKVQRVRAKPHDHPSDDTIAMISWTAGYNKCLDEVFAALDGDEVK